jgi:hypothetical protein
MATQHDIAHLSGWGPFEYRVSVFDSPVSIFYFRFSNFGSSGRSMTEQSRDFPLPPSKRAARRILQRAFVLAGRDRKLRQHIREARLTTLWILEDWDLVWTVIIDRGRIEFERRPAKHPDLTLSWQTADEFFSCGREGAWPESRLELAGGLELQRVASNLLNCFFGYLGHVLRNPVDGAGESLL